MANYMSVWLYKATKMEEDDDILIVTGDGKITDYQNHYSIDPAFIERWLRYDRDKIKCVYQGVEKDVREIVEPQWGMYDRYEVLES